MQITFIIGSIFNVPFQTKTAFLGPLRFARLVQSLLTRLPSRSLSFRVEFFPSNDSVLETKQLRYRLTAAAPTERNLSRLILYYQLFSFN